MKIKSNIIWKKHKKEDIGIFNKHLWIGGMMCIIVINFVTSFFDLPVYLSLPLGIVFILFTLHHFVEVSYRAITGKTVNIPPIIELKSNVQSRHGCQTSENQRWSL